MLLHSNYSSRLCVAKTMIFLAVVLLTLSSCSGLNSKNMVAQSGESKVLNNTGQSIAKIDIRGEKEEIFGGPAFAQKEHIIDAARTTLRQSGLFNSVDEGLGDLVLHIIVRSQSQRHTTMLEYTAITTITYRFAWPNGDLAWTKTYETEFSSHAFSGATRTVEAREGSVRENLAALVDGISNSWKN